MQHNAILMRQEAIRAKLAEWKVEAVLVSSPENIYWLSGFTGSLGYLLITEREAFLATDFRYWTQAAAQSPQYTLFKVQTSQDSIDGLFQESKARRIGLEDEHLTLSHYRRWRQLKGLTWQPLGKALTLLREVKTAGEIALIRQAAAVGDLTMQQFPKIAQPGLTEKQAAWELEKFMRENGADGVGFPIIVAGGPNSGLPHHHPGERPLQLGDTIIVDLGAEVKHYRSDMTRSFHLGGEPSGRFWEIYNIVAEAQRNVLMTMRAGMNGKEVDSLARDTIAAAGYKDYFGHGLGHGLGLAIHEPLRLSPQSEKTILQANSFVTVEPGIYLPDWGGIRIEDLVLIQEDGVAIISQCPQTPVIEQ